MTSQHDPAGKAAVAEGAARTRSHEEIQRLLREEIAELRAALTEREAAPADLERAVERRVAALKLRHEVELALVEARHVVEQGRPPAGVPALKQQIAALKESPLFDAKWYLAQYPDLAGMKAGAAEHHARTGAFEGRDPGPGFDTMAYYLANPDVAAAGWPALVHHVLHGKAEGRPLAPPETPSAPAHRDG